MPLQVVAGAAPHPVSVVCGAALRRTGLVTASDCPMSADGTGLSAWGALGLPGANQVAAVNHSSSPDIAYTPYLTGFVSLLWAFTGFRQVAQQRLLDLVFAQRRDVLELSGVGLTHFDFLPRSVRYSLHHFSAERSTCVV